MKPFRKYTLQGRYDIFRGKYATDVWFVYDTKEDRYVGGSFDTLKEAKAYAEARDE